MLISLALAGSLLPAPQRAFSVVAKFPAAEATQGVAVDDRHFYAITNRRIGKYDRKTGAKRASFEDAPNGRLIHMNGGVVHRGKLYASHSNFPETPMVSSIEVFDTRTLRHERSIPLGIGRGSLVWAIPGPNGTWWACYGHYNGRGGEAGMTNDRTVLDVLDDRFRPTGGFGFPKELVARWDGMTASGAAWAAPGVLFTTGHHAPEVHVLRVPRAGGKLVLTEVISTPCEGQGIDYDPKTKTLWQIQRRERAVYVLSLNPPL
jgi:hypothetical protein